MKSSLFLSIVILSISCGSKSGFTGDTAKATIPHAAVPEANAVPTSPVINDVEKAEPATPFVKLNGLRWELPCTGVVNLAKKDCVTTASVDTKLKMDGDAANAYSVKLRFRGVVEREIYKDGVLDSNGLFYSGGVVNDTGFNIYRLTIQNPAKTYYLNAGPGLEPNVVAIDYTVDVVINGQSGVALYANNQDGTSIANVSNIVAKDLTTPPALLSGQFVQMDVVSVTPIAK